MTVWDALVEQDQRCRRLRGALKRERRLRREAEANAKRFHALLIAERIRKIPKR